MALGRGLGEIFDEVTQAYEEEIPSSMGVVDIEIDAIIANPYQPRKSFDEQSLLELSQSIKRHGLLQPIVVTEGIDGYTLISGERRLRAHKIANIPTIQAIISDIPINKFRELAIIENIQREELSPIDLAISYKELIDEHGITHDQLASTLHKSRAQITNTLRLLQLSPYTKEALSNEKISQGHAKVLIGLEETEQKKMVDSISGQKLSVRDTEESVRDIKNIQKNEKPLKSKPNKVEPIQKEPLDYYKIQEFFALFGVTSSVRGDKIELSFKNNDEINQFLGQFEID